MPRLDLWEGPILQGFSGPNRTASRSPAASAVLRSGWPVDIHLTLDRATPLRAQLERELRSAIRSDRLHSGAKLPPSRVLADKLRVSRSIVVEAYSQLVAENYLVARSKN